MSRVALKYLLVTAFVSGIVAVIWSGHISDHIKHVDYVPPPITAPARQKTSPIVAHTTAGRATHWVMRSWRLAVQSTIAVVPRIAVAGQS